MDELASILGISKRTIYTVFESKEEVLKSCMTSFRDIRDQTILEINEKAENVIIECMQIIDYYRGIQIPNSIFWDDLRKYYPNIHQQIHDGEDNYKTYIKQLLVKGIKDGYFREDLNTDDAIQLLDFNCFIKVGGIYSEAIPHSHVNPIFMITINLVRGISTLKGIEAIDQYMAQAHLYHSITRALSAS